AAKDENIDAMLAEAGGSGPSPAKAPEQVVAQAKEQAGASPVPKSPQQSQGEASMPPQQKVASVAPPPPARAAQQPPAQRADDGNGGRTRSSPLARRIASERGLDISAVQGSGPGGRIIKRDIEAAAAGMTASPRTDRTAGARGEP